MVVLAAVLACVGDGGVEEGCSEEAEVEVGAVDGGMAVRGSVGSVVLRPRSLMVSFCGFSGCSESGISRCDWDGIGSLDSSDELSVPSGVESESKSGRGERRLLARGMASSLSPSMLGLGRFFSEVR